ncbi:MAG: NAD-dependent epimerase/dehydratase family protein, partial [Rhizobacter sp.]
MRVLVTGAGGFIGSRLVEVLRARGRIADKRISALALADRRLADVPASAVGLQGDLASGSMLQRIVDFRPDVVFHLAAV